MNDNHYKNDEKTGRDMLIYCVTKKDKHTFECFIPERYKREDYIIDKIKQTI